MNPNQAASNIFYQDKQPQTTKVFQLPEQYLNLGNFNILIRPHLGPKPTPEIKQKLEQFKLESKPDHIDLVLTPRRNYQFFYSNSPPQNRVDLHLGTDKIMLQGYYFAATSQLEDLQNWQITYFDEYGQLLTGLRIVLAHFLILQKRGLLVHASAAIYKDKGIIFPGHSRKGKTTAISTTPGTILADEVILVDCQKERPAICGTPFGSKLPPHNLSCHDFEVGDLVQSELLKSEKLFPGEILRLLLKNSIYLNQSSQITFKVMELASFIAESVSGNKYFFDKDGKFWHNLF
ncbi:MAG: hypothetical protein PF689_05480 [Deltaproteobacteria bacterium]|jgi:hypothetical protein|nr:hypothetical protein [Deltaproteobacteria bacterium]